MKDDERRIELEDEIRTLEKADFDISAANERIQRQTGLVLELERDGHDTALALKLLATLKESLQAMIVHRQLILDRIDHLRGHDR